MTVTLDTLTVKEAKRLALLEDTISHGVQTFVAVGNALAEIKDGRLYRAEHKTFESYCTDKWHMSRCRAYQLITAAAVVEDLSTNGRQTPSSERVARELADVPSEDRPEVYAEAAAEADGEPTAAQVKAVVTRRRNAKSQSPAEEDVQQTAQSACAEAADGIVCDSDQLRAGNGGPKPSKRDYNLAQVSVRDACHLLTEAMEHAEAIPAVYHEPMRDLLGEASSVIAEFLAKLPGPK